MLTLVLTVLVPLQPVERLIIEGNQLQSAQLFPEAESVYSQAVRAAQPWGEIHGLALALNNRGAVRYRAGHYPEALADYLEAHRIWRQLKRPVDEGKASVNLAELYHAQGDDTAALRWAEAATATTPAGEASVQALTIKGNSLRNMGRLTESLKFLDEAVARELAGRPKLLSLPLAYALLGQAQSRLALGLLEEADQAAQRSREILTAFYGEASLPVARVAVHQAQFARLRGNLAEAERDLRSVLEIQQKVLPDGHPQLAPAMVQLAELLALRRRFDEAGSLAKRALMLVREGLGESHPDYAAMLLSVADLYRNQRLFDEAGRYYRDAIQQAEASGVATQARFASYLNNYATLLVEQGRFAEAEPLFRRALAHREKLWGASHYQNAELLFNLAVVTMFGQRWQEAQTFVERSLALKQQLVGDQHPSLAPALKLYGQLLLHNGQKKRAKEVARLYARIEAVQPAGQSVDWQALRSFR